MRDLLADQHRRRRDRTVLYARRLARQAVQAGAIRHRRWFRPWRLVEQQTGLCIDELGDFTLAVVLSGGRPKCPHGGRGCFCWKTRGLGKPIQEQRDLECYRHNSSPLMKRLHHHIQQRLARK